MYNFPYLPDADFSFSKRGFRTNHNLRIKSIIDIEKEIDTSTKQTNDLSEYSSSSDDNNDYIYESSEEDDSETKLLLSKSVKNLNIRQYGPSVGEHYNESMMMTGIRIVKMQEFGTISAFKKRNKNEVSADIENAIPIQKDSYAKAVRYAKNIVSTSDYFHDASKDNDPMYDLALNYIPENNFANDSSWARRKGYGQLYGETYMDEFKDELQRMFREGTIDDGNKMNLGKMRETLMNIFPHKFSIPSELEI